jgi:acyl-CoA synthetase (NDP forming)
MKGALDVMLAAPEFDLILAVVGSSARFHPELAVKPIIDSAGAGKPIAAYLVPDAPAALAALAAAGVPSFHTPEACADVIAAALRRRPPVAIQSHSTRPGGTSGGGRLLDELEAYKLLGGVGIACAPSLALDAATKKVPPLPFPYPVAVKVLSSEITHKTDIGGVVLNVTDDAALLAAIQKICASAAERAPGARIDRVLVQPMVSGLGEVLIGYRVDPDVGPLVMVAAGGVLTEIYRDRSLRLAPVDLATAREMIAEVRGLAVLSGFRGKPDGDLDALAHALVALSQLATATEPAVAEAEINPLIVRPRGQGVVAVDALVRLVV